MKKGYFKDVFKSLQKKTEKKSLGINFVNLKGYEYWIRMLRISKNYPDADDSIGIFPIENASRILRGITTHFELLNKAEDRLPKTKDPKSRSPRNKIDECFYGIEEDEGKSESYRERKRAIGKIRDTIKNSSSSEDIKHVTHCTLVGEDIFNGPAKKIFYEGIIKELMDLLKHQKNIYDPYLKRLDIVQKAFNLDSVEMEILIFSWIFFKKDICDPLRDMIGSRRFGDCVFVDVFASIYPELDIEKACSNKSSLKRMGLVDNDLEISKRIGLFLDGVSGNDLDSLYFKIYDGNSVPYKKLCNNNPKVEVAFDLLKHVKPNRGINIFFYGVEGTGKTELAKAIAKELKRPLVLTNISIDGVHRESKEDSTIQERLGSIMFAATKYQNKRAILLVDEADVILNCCEKGALNFFLEQINVPVIWISNNIRFIEDSTLRRFDYSIEFERLDSEKRLQIWQSVISEQGTGKMLEPLTVQQFADTYPITAGGVTQAIAGAKLLQETGSKIPPEKAVRIIAEAQTNLLSLSREYTKRDKESHAPKYILDALNVEGDMNHIMKVVQSFNTKWETMQEMDCPESLNILFYGVPGTGKTELAKHIARTLDRKLIVKKASDLLDCYVGETEKKIRKMFREAEEKKAILFLDEADSMLSERAGAEHSWEVTQVNELLTQMENFKGIFIAATNFNDNLDAASRRRFALKLKFNYLKPDGIEKVWQAFFPKVECSTAARDLKALAPGDFKAVYDTFKYYEESEVTTDSILEALRHEIECKNTREGRRMGL
jgi:SpoVK/Ycf46/Vps4 family AAA+-type ATPase